MKILLAVVLTLALIMGCVSENELTPEELKIQNKADLVVSTILFEHDMNTLASYNIRKDGSLTISFDESVSETKYTEIVNKLRLQPQITQVRAEHSGREVCILKSKF